MYLYIIVNFYKYYLENSQANYVHEDKLCCNILYNITFGYNGKITFNVYTRSII